LEEVPRVSCKCRIFRVLSGLKLSRHPPEQRFPPFPDVSSDFPAFYVYRRDSRIPKKARGLALCSLTGLCEKSVFFVLSPTSFSHLSGTHSALCLCGLRCGRERSRHDVKVLFNKLFLNGFCVVAHRTSFHLFHVRCVYRSHQRASYRERLPAQPVDATPYNRLI
jgi:hypothetical protein